MQRRRIGWLVAAAVAVVACGIATGTSGSSSAVAAVVAGLAGVVGAVLAVLAVGSQRRRQGPPPRRLVRDVDERSVRHLDGEHVEDAIGLLLVTGSLLDAVAAQGRLPETIGRRPPWIAAGDPPQAVALGRSRSWLVICRSDPPAVGDVVATISHSSIANVELDVAELALTHVHLVGLKIVDGTALAFAFEHDRLPAVQAFFDATGRAGPPA